MSLQRLRLGISSAPSIPAQRHCYVSAQSLERLLASPGALERLLFELQADLVTTAPFAEQLARVERSAIHLSVTRSRFHGLSVEEVVVLTAYTSRLFEQSSWKRELLHEPAPETLMRTCRRWLDERATQVRSGHAVDRPHWALVGQTPPDRVVANPFVIAVAPLTSALAIERELAPLTRELGFAHEHYIACTPATALAFLARSASVEEGLRWDPFVLDRRLRSSGLGLLLVEPEGVLLYLPARYHPNPVVPP